MSPLSRTTKEIILLYIIISLGTTTNHSASVLVLQRQ